MGQFETQPSGGSATTTTTSTTTDSSFSTASASAGRDYSPQEEQQRQALVNKFDTTRQYDENVHAQQVQSENLEVLLIRNPQLRQLLINPASGNMQGYGSNFEQTVARQDKIAEDLARGLRQGTLPTTAVGFDEWSSYWKQTGELNYANFVGGQYLEDYKAQFTTQRNERVQSMQEQKDAALLRRLEAIPGNERSKDNWETIWRLREQMKKRAEDKQTPAQTAPPAAETDPAMEAANNSEYALRMEELKKELADATKGIALFSGRQGATTQLAYYQKAVERTELLIDAELRLQSLRLLPQSPENEQKIQALTEFREAEQNIRKVLEEVRGIAPLVRSGSEAATARYGQLETWMRANADYRQGGDLRLPNKDKFSDAYEIINGALPTPD